MHASSHDISQKMFGFSYIPHLYTVRFHAWIQGEGDQGSGNPPSEIFISRVTGDLPPPLP